MSPTEDAKIINVRGHYLRKYGIKCISLKHFSAPQIALLSFFLLVSDLALLLADLSQSEKQILDLRCRDKEFAGVN